MEILISPEDQWLLTAYRWRQDKLGYVFFDAKMGGRVVRFLMHRVIKNAPKGVLVDHIDGNPMNNRRENLRLCSHAENMKNRRGNRNSSTGVKGVSLAPGNRRFKYKAEIKADGNRLCLGYFEHVADAALAYRLAAITYHGEFARFA